MKKGNPLRWLCSEDGCFNRHRRPKIEVFSDCFPRRINFGDVDMLVEIGGNLLFGEWKCKSSELPVGQRLLHEALLGYRHAVFVAVGSAETMGVESFVWRHLGKTERHDPGNLGELKDRVSAWARWADRSRRAA